MSSRKLLDIGRRSSSRRETYKDIDIDLLSSLRNDEIFLLESLGLVSDQGTIPYEYKEAEMGLVGDNASSCTLRHLSAIENRLRVLQLLYVAHNPKIRINVLPDVAEVEKELLRLSGHPELFANEEIKRHFWQSVYTKLKGVPLLMKRGQGIDYVEHSLLQDDHQEHFEWTKLPSRQPHLNPWEQFLNNKAPGAGIDFSDEEDGSVHVLPYAACRIMKAVQMEMTETAERIESERERLAIPPSHPITPGKAMPSNITVEGNCRTFDMEFGVFDPAIASLRTSPLTYAPLLLEQLNSNYAEIRRGRLPAPRVWNTSCLIIRDYAIDE